jgi:hypothetical protein
VKAIKLLLEKVFPVVPVHTRGEYPLLASQELDPFHTPLEAHEEGCGPARSCRVVLDAERDGQHFLTFNY